MYNLGLYLKTELEKYNGFTAVLTRKSVDENPSLTNRGNLAISNKSDVFISLHTDAFNNSSAKGVTVFRSIKRPKSENLGQNLGKSITNFMNTYTGVTTFRGVKTQQYSSTSNNDYHGVIRSSVKGVNVQYSFLIEHGFHTNKHECSFLNDNTNLMKLASVIAKVFADYFKVSLKESQSTYDVVKTIPGYSTASDALKGINKKTTVQKGKYYIYRTYKNGCINITSDKTCKVPGAWVNPKDNKI